MGIRQTMPIGMSRKILNAFSIHVGGFSKRRCRITKTGFDAGVERRFLKDIQLVAVHTINRKLSACVEGGVNRLSIGVQTFNADIRKEMQRLDSTLLAKVLIKCQCSCGFIMTKTGLSPFSTISDHLASLRSCIQL